MSTSEDMDRIKQALLLPEGHDQRRIVETAIEWAALILRKNADYGSNVWKAPLLAPNLPPGITILVWASDKLARLGQLQRQGAEIKEESFDDTIRDLGAYCLLYLARPREDVPTQMGASAAGAAHIIRVGDRVAGGTVLSSDTAGGCYRGAQEIVGGGGAGVDMSRTTNPMEAGGGGSNVGTAGGYCGDPNAHGDR